MLANHALSVLCLNRQGIFVRRRAMHDSWARSPHERHVVLTNAFEKLLAGDSCRRWRERTGEASFCTTDARSDIAGARILETPHLKYGWFFQAHQGILKII
jgi:hypothetical protein